MQADCRSYILPLANKDVGSTRVHGGCTLAMRWLSIRVHVYEQSESNKQNKHCLSQRLRWKTERFITREGGNGNIEDQPRLVQITCAVWVCDILQCLNENTHIQGLLCVYVWYCVWCCSRHAVCVCVFVEMRKLACRAERTHSFEV